MRFNKALILPVLFLFCSSPTEKRFSGSWRVASIRYTIHGKTSVVADPQPGLALFTGKHYSMAWIPSQEPRQPSARIWFPDDGEKIAAFDTFIMNSGAYTVTDSTLITYPIVAKTPEFMGGRSVFRWWFTKDTLWLRATEIISFNDIPDPGPNIVVTDLGMLRIE